MSWNKKMIKEEIQNLIKEGKQEPSDLSNGELARLFTVYCEQHRQINRSVVYSEGYVGDEVFRMVCDGIDPERASLLALWHCTGLTEMMESMR